MGRTHRNTKCPGYRPENSTSHCASIVSSALFVNKTKTLYPPTLTFILISWLGRGTGQEFFYHVLLVLDSYTFNIHLKTELAAEIARLYQQQTTFKARRDGVEHVDEGGGASSVNNSAAGEGLRGFTGTMVKLKVCRRCLEVPVPDKCRLPVPGSPVRWATLSTYSRRQI